MRKFLFCILVALALSASAQEEGDWRYNHYDHVLVVGPDTVTFVPSFAPFWRFTICVFMGVAGTPNYSDSILVTIYKADGDTLAYRPVGGYVVERFLRADFYGPDVDSFTVYSFGVSCVKLDVFK